MFSATFSDSFKELAATFMDDDYVFVNIGENEEEKEAQQQKPLHWGGTTPKNVKLTTFCVTRLTFAGEVLALQIPFKRLEKLFYQI